MRDQASIRRTFQVLRTRKLPFWLVSFLEGTRASSEKILESQKFCEERNLPILKHMLFPRTKGFVATIQGLRDSTDSVLDITFACDGGRVPTVVDLAMRRMPDFHVHVRRYPVKYVLSFSYASEANFSNLLTYHREIPTDEEDITQWIIKRFVEKDELLSYFHKNGKFPEPASQDLWPVPYKHKTLNLWEL
jgi:lysocardiolipin and lysophospholipid acyltransferase